MKRNTTRRVRKSLGVVIGLVLGLYTAELAFLQVPQTSYAAAGASHPQATGGKGHDHVAAIEQLKPSKDHGSWYGSVLWYSALLFIAAAALGPLILASKVDLPEPAPRKAAGHHDAAHGGHGH